jgi:two-component system sensor histidine kinase RegB
MQALSWYSWRRFVDTVSSTLRKPERRFAHSPGDPDSRHLIRMGALAAGAAHDLGSPLTTMAVLLDELRQQQNADDRRRFAETLRIMSDQIEACRDILAVLVAHGRDAQGNDGRSEPLERAARRRT